MKIEKINDNKIKCTLTRSDLESRKIRLNELAYGSEKAKKLFQDMMQQAHSLFGFDSGNSPLMIEAIPTSTDSITLIITKVDDPEELDTRFSRFSPSDEDLPPEAKQFSGADAILDLFKRIKAARNNDANNTEGNDSSTKKATDSANTSTGPTSDEKEGSPSTINLMQAFSFTNIDHLIDAAHSLNHAYNGNNSLFKDRTENDFILILHQSDCSPEQFNKVCNILTEYGTNRYCSAAYEAYLLEHADMIIRNQAIQNLAQY